MRVRTLMIGAVLLVGIAAHGQTLIVKEFKGTSIGEKLRTAQAACQPGPCVLVIGPELANFSAGTTPPACANCYWVDFTHAGGLASSGFRDFATQTSPGNPPAGYLRFYADANTGLLTCLNSSGVSCLSGGGGGGASWGTITGTLSSQLDLQAALNAKVATTTTVCGHALSANVACTAADVGLSSVTNDAQTKAAIVPNTAPLAGQVPIGNAGNTAYAPSSLSGDCMLASTGAITCTKTAGAAFAASATTDATNAANIASGTLPDARLSNVVTAATCGDATHSCGLTYDAHGRITAATNNVISGGGGTATWTAAGFLTSGVGAGLTKFVGLTNSQTNISSAAGAQTVWGATCTLKNFYVSNISGAVAAGGTVVFTLVVNGAAAGSPGTVTVTFNASDPQQTVHSDLTNTAAVIAGNIAGWQIVNNSSGTTPTFSWFATCQ